MIWGYPYFRKHPYKDLVHHPIENGCFWTTRPGVSRPVWFETPPYEKNASVVWGPWNFSCGARFAVDGSEIPRPTTLRCVVHPVNTGISTSPFPQLVSWSPDFWDFSSPQRQAIQVDLPNPQPRHKWRKPQGCQREDSLELRGCQRPRGVQKRGGGGGEKIVRRFAGFKKKCIVIVLRRMKCCKNMKVVIEIFVYVCVCKYIYSAYKYIYIYIYTVSIYTYKALGPYRLLCFWLSSGPFFAINSSPSRESLSG